MAPVLAQITQGRKVATLPARAARVHRVSYAPNQHMPLHAHQTANVTVIVAGRLADSAAGARHECAALSVLVKPSGSSHETLSGPRGAQTIVVEVEQELEHSLRKTVGLFEAEEHLSGGPAARLVLDLWRGVQRASPHDPNVEPWLEELGDHTATLPRGAQDDPALCRAKELLAERSGAASVARVAESLGLHPVSLARWFRRELGCTPCEYRRRARLCRAAEQIAHSRRPLASIAHEAGFSDQAHLTRELRRESGLTPRAFRALAMPAWAV